jgi:hypothetical protein
MPQPEREQFTSMSGHFVLTRPGYGTGIKL